MISITHAGPYKLAYDRIHNYGELEPDPEHRVFNGTQALQDALNVWASNLDKAIDNIIGQKPKYILTGGLYVDKAMAHGDGIAIDVDGFWVSEKERYLASMAPGDWPPYLKIEAHLRQLFGVVLNYDYNVEHHDHWHCDLTRECKWYPGKSQTFFTQRALNTLFASSIDVDGEYDSETQQALQTAGFNFPNDWKRFLEEVIKR